MRGKLQCVRRLMPPPCKPGLKDTHASAAAKAEAQAAANAENHR
jgi:hypothetical protein